MIKARYKAGETDPILFLMELRSAWSNFRKQSAQMLFKVRKNAAPRLHKAYLRAKASGYREGKCEAELDRAALLLQAQQAYENTVRHAQKDCLNLVLDLAHEILATELTLNTKSIATRITQMISHQLEHRKLRIHVHPAQLEAIRSIISEQNPELSLTLYPQDSIPYGKARLESLAGNIELDWESSLSVLGARLHMRLEQMPNPPTERES